ncbi:uncharacterized protein LOC111121286 [Crassostrea virginica]
MTGFGCLYLIICYGLSLAYVVLSFPFFAYHKLPSSNVPVNCGGNRSVYMVTGLGHQLCGEDYFITKKQNVTQFGKDFMIYMDDWPTLCKMDSDKDNRTNGEELGDPNCTWINKDERVAVSHPGYAEDEVIDDNGEVSYVIVDQEGACGTPDKQLCWRYIIGQGLVHRR